MSYGTRYRVDYRSQRGTPNRVTILQRDYAGEFEQLSWGGESPFIIEYDWENLHSPIAASSAKLTIHTEENFKFREFFVADDEEFVLKHEEDTGSGYVERWTGFVVPDEHFERYTPKPYRTEIKAVDGIGYLEGKFLNSYSGRVKVTELLHEIFGKLGEAYSGEYWINHESYFSGANTDRTPLSQVEVDRKNYTDKSADNDEAEDMDCLQILKSLLGAPFYLHCFKDEFQGKASFMIAGVFERREVNQKWYKISAGAEDGSETEDFRRVIESDVDDNSKMVPILNDHDLLIDKAYRKAEVSFESKHTVSENIVPNFNWRYFNEDSDDVPLGWTNSGMTVENTIETVLERNQPGGQPIRIVESGFDDYMESQSVDVIDATYKLSGSFQHETPMFGEQEVARFPRFKMQIRWTDGVDTKYLRWTAENPYHWTDSENFVYWRQSDEKGREIGVSITPPNPGSINIRIYGSESGITSFNSSDSRTADTYAPKFILKPFSLIIEEADLERQRVLRDSEIEYSTEKLEFNSIHLDTPGVNGKSSGAITDESGDVTGGWSLGVEDGETVLRHFLRLILDTYRKPLRTWSGSLWTADDLRYRHMIQMSEGVDSFRHLQGGASYDYRNSVVNIRELREVTEYSGIAPITVDDDYHGVENINASLSSPGSGDTGGLVWLGESVGENHDMPALAFPGVTEDWHRYGSDRVINTEGTHKINTSIRVVYVDCTAGNITVQLDMNVADVRGAGVKIKRTDTSVNNCLITPKSGDKIEGDDVLSLLPRESAEIVAGNPQWNVLNSFQGQSLSDLQDQIDDIVENGELDDQYLRLDGTNSMAGDLDMDNNNLVNVNQINGTDADLSGTLDVDGVSTFNSDIDLNHNDINDIGFIEARGLYTGSYYANRLILAFGGSEEGYLLLHKYQGTEGDFTIGRIDGFDEGATVSRGAQFFVSAWNSNGTSTQKGILQSNHSGRVDKFELVTLDYNGETYIAIGFTGVSFPAWDQMYFNGHHSSTASDGLTYVRESNVSNVSTFQDTGSVTDFTTNLNIHQSLNVIGATDFNDNIDLNSNDILNTGNIFPKTTGVGDVGSDSLEYRRIHLSDGVYNGSNKVFNADRTTPEQVYMVGTGGDYPSFNSAIADLIMKFPVYQSDTEKIELRAVSGFVMAEQIIVKSGINLGRFILTSEDAEVEVDATAITLPWEPETETDSVVFGAQSNSTLPTIGTVFNMVGTAGEKEDKSGIFLWRGSKIVILPDCGFTNSGSTNLAVKGGSQCVAQQGEFSGGAHRNISCEQSSSLFAPGCTAEGGGTNNITVRSGGVVDIRNANLNNCVGGWAADIRSGAWFVADGCSLDNNNSHAVRVLGAGDISLVGSSIQNNGFAIFVDDSGSTTSGCSSINIANADLSGNSENPNVHLAGGTIVRAHGATGASFNVSTNQFDGSNPGRGIVFN